MARYLFGGLSRSVFLGAATRPEKRENIEDHVDNLAGALLLLLLLLFKLNLSAKTVNANFSLWRLRQGWTGVRAKPISSTQAILPAKCSENYAVILFTHLP